MVLLVESSTEMDFWPGTQAGSIHCHGPSSPSLDRRGGRRARRSRPWGRTLRGSLSNLVNGAGPSPGVVFTCEKLHSPLVISIASTAIRNVTFISTPAA